MDLSPQQIEFFSSMQATFQTPGWTLLTQGWQSEIDITPSNAFYNAKTIEDVALARERVKLLHELIALPAVMEMQRKQVEDMDPTDG